MKTFVITLGILGVFLTGLGVFLLADSLVDGDAFRIVLNVVTIGLGVFIVHTNIETYGMLTEEE